MEERILEIRKGLGESTEKLVRAADRLELTINARALRLLQPRLEQGMVRVAVIGATSSGKSTLINALLEQIVVPENPNVSSPIPVWIGYAAQKEPVFTVYEEHSETGIQKTEYPAATFLKSFCYSLKDTINRDTDRFKDVRYGSVSLSSPCLRSGCVLIDTLGISASNLDTAKTNAVLEEGVDMVLFVSSNLAGSHQFTRSEVDYLRQSILGLEPGTRQVSHPVDPKNILFVHNLYGDSQPDRQIMNANLDTVLAGMSPDIIDDVKAHNVFYVQALWGRLNACGVYDYVANAPEGCGKPELQDAEKSKIREEAEEKQYTKDDLEKNSGMAALRSELINRTKGQIWGRNSAAIHRIGELRVHADGLQLSASERLAAANRNQAELEALNGNIQKVIGQVDKEKKRVSADLKILQDNFLNQLNAAFVSVHQKTCNQVYGKVNLLAPPATFVTDWQKFRKVPDATKQKYIMQCASYAMSEVLEVASSSMTEILSYGTGGQNEPLAVMEKTRIYIRNVLGESGSVVRTVTDSMQNLGMDKNQMNGFLKSADRLCEELRSRLEEQVKTAAKNSISTGGKAYEQRMERYMGKLVGTNVFMQMWNQFLANFQTAEGFWTTVRKSVLLPLAKEAMEDLETMAVPAQSGAGSPLVEAIKSAYGEAEKEILEVFSSLKCMLELYYNTQQGLASNGQALTEQQRADYREIEIICSGIRDTLNGWTQELESEAHARE